MSTHRLGRHHLFACLALVCLVWVLASRSGSDNAAAAVWDGRVASAARSDVGRRRLHPPADRASQSMEKMKPI